MSAAARNRTALQVRCPRCLASPGYCCTSPTGEHLLGVHIQRTTNARSAIQAALRYYAGLGLKTKRHVEQFGGAQ
jgi:hypothetical protein